MGVYWYLVNLTKGGYVGRILGKTGEFDFQKEYDSLAGNSEDTFYFISDGFDNTYIPYPFKTPFPSEAWGKDSDDELISWELKNSQRRNRKVKLSNGKMLTLDVETRQRFIDNKLPVEKKASKTPSPKTPKTPKSPRARSPSPSPKTQGLASSVCGAKTKTGTCKMKVMFGEKCWRHATPDDKREIHIQHPQFEVAKGIGSKMFVVIDEWYGDDAHVEVIGVYGTLDKARTSMQKYIVSTKRKWVKGTNEESDVMEGFVDKEYPLHFIGIHDAELE